MMSMEDIKRSLEGKAEVSYDEKSMMLKIATKPENLKNVAKVLKELGFDHVKSVTAVDDMPQKKIHVLYHASSYLREGLQRYVVQIECEVPRDDPEVESLADVWPSALFHERETYEMFGVVFRGHGDLRPILLPDELVGKWPMRKDFRG